MSISGRYPFPLEYFTVATGLGQSCDGGRYGSIPEARKNIHWGRGSLPFGVFMSRPAQLTN